MSTVRRVKVGGETPTAADVLEYAVELIDAYGWNNTSKSADGTTVEYTASGDEQGFTLHDAIGEACTRLSRATGGRANKDWSVTNAEGASENLRATAQEYVNAVILEDYADTATTDYELNDTAQSADVVKEVLLKARAKAEANQ